MTTERMCQLLAADFARLSDPELDVALRAVIERLEHEQDTAVAALTPHQRADYEALVAAGAGRLDAFVAVTR